MVPPYLICLHNHLVAARGDYFERIGRLDPRAMTLEMNVTRAGTAGIAWLIDMNAELFLFTSEGLLPKTLPQTLGLARRREKYRLSPGRRITVAELRGLIEPLHDRWEEAPMVADLKQFLAPFAPSQPFGPEEFRRYMGEQPAGFPPARE